MDWLAIFEKFGPYLGIIFFFIWRDSKREEQLNAQLHEAHQFIVTKLIDLVKESTEALHERKSSIESDDPADHLQPKV